MKKIRSHYARLLAGMCQNFFVIQLGQVLADIVVFQEILFPQQRIFHLVFTLSALFVFLVIKDARWVKKTDKKCSVWIRKLLEETLEEMKK